MAFEKFNSIVALVIWFHPSQKEVHALSLYKDNFEHVIIVDNSDTDNSRLCADIANAHYIPLCANKGIAAALNIGCNKALQLGAEWVLTMDQDSLWNQHSVQQYIDEAAQYPDFEKVGIFAPFHDCDGHPEVHKTLGRFEQKKIIMCSGNLLRLKAWQEVNGFREDFFIDNVDDEICCHLRQEGWQIVRTNKILLTHSLGNGVQIVKIIHHPYTSHTAWRYFYIARNMRWMAQLYPDMAKYYKKYLRKELKRLCLYDWDDKCNKIKNYIRGMYAGRCKPKQVL
ncbi:MAG: glycosyltransferase [Paludibacteraceae bacterium]|nr:glycosyltransferase [Paludibacteraceae bacterium]